MLQSLSVAEYSRQFFDRVLKGSYGETLEDNRRVAGDNFVCEPPAPHAVSSKQCQWGHAGISSPARYSKTRVATKSLQHSWLTVMAQGVWYKARSCWGGKALKETVAPGVARTANG